MFDPSSRYAAMEIAAITLTDPEGGTQLVRYVRRRFVPPTEGLASLVEHTVTQGERLDNITARYLGDPTQFWRVCDANTVLRPEELSETPGRQIRIATPLG